MAFFIGLTAAFVLVILQRVWQLEKQVLEVTGKLDALLAHSGIEYDPTEGIDDRVVEVLKQSGKIEAIKVYRAATGASLVDGKKHVEDIQAKEGL